MVELISLRDDFFSHSWKLSRVPFLQQKARKLNPNNSPKKIYYHKRCGCDSCISSTCRSQLFKNTFQIYNSQKLFLEQPGILENYLCVQQFLFIPSLLRLYRYALMFFERIKNEYNI